MADFKCKICGGTFTFDKSSGTTRCEYCGHEEIVVSKEELDEISQEERDRTEKEKAEAEEKEKIYRQASMYMEKSDEILSVKAAYKFYNQIPGYKDSDLLAQKCRFKIEALENKRANDAQKQRTRNNIILTIGVLFLLGMFVYTCMSMFK